MIALACLTVAAFVAASREKRVPLGEEKSSPPVTTSGREAIKPEDSVDSSTAEGADHPTPNLRFSSRQDRVQSSPIVGPDPHAVRHTKTHPADDSPPVAVAALPLIYQIDGSAFAERFPNAPPALLEAMRQEFERQLGAGGLAIDSPEYAERWNRAAPGVMDRLRTLFGWAAVAELERQVAASEHP